MVFGSIMIFILVFLLGSLLWAVVAAYVLSLTFPPTIDERSAARVKDAARLFWILYPASVFVGFSLLTGGGVGRSMPPAVAGLLLAGVPAVVACLPLAAVLAVECRSIAVGVTPLLAIGLTLGVTGAMTGFTGGDFALVWCLIAPPIWLALTFAGVRWVVRPQWPLAKDPGTLCGSCGYSLEGLTSALCPECGSPLPGPADAANSAMVVPSAGHSAVHGQ